MPLALAAMNGQLVANGGEAYASKANVIRSLDSVRRNAQSEGHTVTDENGKPLAE